MKPSANHKHFANALRKQSSQHPCEVIVGVYLAAVVQNQTQQNW